MFISMDRRRKWDNGFGNAKKFAANLGEDGLKKLAELSCARIQESQTNLLAFNPKMSYVADD